jgi:hypothetical protein
MDQFQTDFRCTYKRMLDPEDQENLYRIQLLQAFNMNTWDDDAINDTVTEIYRKISQETDFKIIFIKAQTNKSLTDMLALFNEDKSIEKNEIIFTMLFKYEYFDLLHRCISDYLREGQIKKDNFEMLMNAL